MAICRNGWAFGIDRIDGSVKLWSPYGKEIFLFEHFPNAKKFCIGEKSGVHMSDYYSHPWYDTFTPFLFVNFDGGASSAWLHCTGVGRDDKDALLKIVNYDDGLARGGDPIVKFKKGPGYDNALWWIDAFGRPHADYGCDWFLDVATASPSASPSAGGPSVLYGYTRVGFGKSTPTTLNILNQDNGEILSSVGQTGVGQITAAATDPVTGNIYGSPGGFEIGACLLKGDVTTGVVSEVGCDPTYGGDVIPGLAIDSVGNIYGMLSAEISGTLGIYLVSVNKVNGALTVKGQSGNSQLGTDCPGNGIEFGPNDILYYHNTCDGGLGTVNLETGAVTLIGESFTGFPFPGLVSPRVSDMAYDRKSGVMYAAVSSPASLATVDLATGEFTYVGNLELGNGRTNSITFV